MGGWVGKGRWVKWGDFFLPSVLLSYFSASLRICCKWVGGWVGG